MHIDLIPNRNSPPAYLLRESYREDGKVKKRTLANITHWPAGKIEALRRLLRDEYAPHEPRADAACPTAMSRPRSACWASSASTICWRRANDRERAWWRSSPPWWWRGCSTAPPRP